LTHELIKYFVHGIAFSFLLLILGIAWVILFAVLVMVGMFIGLIIGLVCLFYIIGGLNVVLTNLIWDVQVMSDWKHILAHGFVLFFILLIVGIPVYLFALASPSLVALIVGLIIYALIDGFIAKNVANWWEVRETEEYEELGEIV
jgi:hypothetical protein